MLQNALPEIKGRLLHHFFETYSGMNTYQEDGKTKIDYEEFYAECEWCVRAIFDIKSISDLDVFCEEWGLNEFGSDFELSFFNLANEYLNPKPRQSGDVSSGKG